MSALEKRVAVFSGTRADYGLLYWTLKALDLHPDVSLMLMLGGNHGRPEWGSTIDNIREDGFTVTAELDSGSALNTDLDMAYFSAETQRLAARYFSEARPDFLIILGDRYEALAVTQAAFLLHIPVVHLHGGELTLGALDDGMRHAITQMSAWHVTATERYRQRVIQLGADPGRVWNLGAPGLEQLLRQPVISIDELSASLGGRLKDPFFLVTYHPETAGSQDALSVQQAVFAALARFPSHQVLITYPNADACGYSLIRHIEDWQSRHPDSVVAVPNLGQRRYVNALRLCSAVVGNSSSGIIEAPSCGVPTVNIGERQKGREQAASVINCASDEEAIAAALSRALSLGFIAGCRGCRNPYGDGLFSEKFMSLLSRHRFSVDKRQTFFDMPADWIRQLEAQRNE